METLFTSAQGYLVSLLQYPFDPARRIYFGYLLGSLLIIWLWMATAYLRRQPAHALALWRTAFDKDIWWHRSARLDYQLLIVNPIIRLSAIGMLGLSLSSLALATESLLYNAFGSISLNWSSVQVTAAYTLVLFIADDLTRFLLHMAMHRIPSLWSIHRLHHSAEVMTPFTVYRIHPLESLLYSMRMVGTQGMVLGLFFFGFGMNLSVWEIAGANLFTYLFNLAGANLRHSHLWISWGPWLERVFISPAQHQIHHSTSPQHFNKNMGAFLAIWDLIFGTLLLARNQTVPGFGLNAQMQSPHQNLWQAYLEPIQHALYRVNAYFKIKTSKLLK